MLTTTYFGATVWQGGTETRVSMRLSTLLQTYFSQRECSPRYLESMQRTIKRLAEYRIQTVCQLAPETINKFLSAVPVGPTTRANYRREILTLWRFAFEHGLTATPPLRVLRIRPARRPVVAWSLDECRRLLALAEKDETPLLKRKKLRRCDILPAWILLAFDSGLRFSDVLNCRHSDIRNGCVAVVVSKTGRVETRRLSSACVAAIASLPKSPDGTLFRWALTRRMAFRGWRDFLDANRIHGSTKYFRRSGATQVMAHHGAEAASQFLGHSANNPHLAKQHYIDSSLSVVPPGPPPLR